ncbi:MAG: hypothetical protein ABSB34_03000 [Candidatus Limnocylindrales bacterium]|jgi:hypothetical protein
MTTSTRVARWLAAAILWAIVLALAVGSLRALIDSPVGPFLPLVLLLLASYGLRAVGRAFSGSAGSGDGTTRLTDLFAAFFGWLVGSGGHSVDPNAPRPIRYYSKKASTWRTEFSDGTVERRENPVGLLRPRRGEPDDEDLCRFANGIARVALANVISHGLESEVRAVTKAPPPPERVVKRDPKTGAETVSFVPVRRYPKAETARCVIKAAVTIPDRYHAVIFDFERAEVSNEIWKRLHDPRNWIESLASRLPGMTVDQLDEWLVVDDERIAGDPVLGRIPGIAITLAHGAARIPKESDVEYGEPQDDPSDPFFSSPFGRGGP